jgi:hypothetical protein
MRSNGVSHPVIVLFFGAIGVVVWAFASQEQLERKFA